ncbi:uncharacterized protein F5147DRAFT_658063 [Suillus discolor]|uniref:Uncharacterized protein n=1 Tax=Suillus discolor TaxID=1912936 RepID=A0A9P7JMW6_9AGAM|nr:uncharacterized protein F5147DRAFT_658063 [Suillus discolor]KAG2090922.1 hypothetical protein F5147DRAFT_658063 [Suillus discolor]
MFAASKAHNSNRLMVVLMTSLFACHHKWKPDVLKIPNDTVIQLLELTPETQPEKFYDGKFLDKITNMHKDQIQRRIKVTSNLRYVEYMYKWPSEYPSERFTQFNRGTTHQFNSPPHQKPTDGAPPKVRTFARMPVNTQPEDPADTLLYFKTLVERVKERWKARDDDVEIVEPTAKRALTVKDRAVNEEHEVEIVELPAAKRAFTGKERATDEDDEVVTSSSYSLTPAKLLAHTRTYCNIFLTQYEGWSLIILTSWDVGTSIEQETD